MKKVIPAVIALVLVSGIVTLTGCEMSFDLKKEPVTASLNGTNPNVAETIIVEITDEQGGVLETQSVTLSKEDNEIKDNFFESAGPNKPNAGPSSDRVNAPEASAQDDRAILDSDQYMITVRIEDNGEDIIYKIARKGIKSSMMFDYAGQEIGMIIDNENVYLLSVGEKIYVKAPKSLLKENSKDPQVKEMLDGNPLKFDRTVISETKETVDGVEYTVCEYKNGVKDYYTGKTIIKTVADDGSVMYYDSVSPVAPDSLFAPPKDFVQKDLTEASLSGFANTITSSVHNLEHDHDHDHK